MWLGNNQVQRGLQDRRIPPSLFSGSTISPVWFVTLDFWLKSACKEEEDLRAIFASPFAPESISIQLTNFLYSWWVTYVECCVKYEEGIKIDIHQNITYTASSRIIYVLDGTRSSLPIYGISFCIVFQWTSHVSGSETANPTTAQSIKKKRVLYVRR